jgi:hypothetical protein
MLREAAAQRSGSNHFKAEATMTHVTVDVLTSYLRLLKATSKQAIPWSTVLLTKITGPQLVKYPTPSDKHRRFIAVSTTAHYLYLSWPGSIQSTTPNPISLRSILILSFQLRLWLGSALFWDITRRRVVVYRRFGTTYRSHLDLWRWDR